MKIIHHGAIDGVTGSCHELVIDETHSILVDCGLFQGEDETDSATSTSQLEIEFPISSIKALLITHCHIDHVGRLPYLLAAGFHGPIYCSAPTAILLPLVLEDALRMGFTKKTWLIKQVIKEINSLITPLPYSHWTDISLNDSPSKLAVRFQPAGHILGSAYIECKVKTGKDKTKVLFSGDLGAPYTPLLPAPKPPWSADILVLESTYGDRLHEGRRSRRQSLKQLVERCFENRGSLLIPAFSIGRTQELLYELEDIIHHHSSQMAAKGIAWEDVEIILDSPLAARFTEAYKQLRPYWDNEAKQHISRGRHPLSFEQITTIDDHISHLDAVRYLTRSTRPTIIIAASGMCAGGRIVNYLKALLGDPKTDVLFVGYQASGTPGRIIQRYGPSNGYVELDGERYDIRAGIHTIGGYSAHADQKNLIDFARRMRRQPREIRLVHGEREAKQALKTELENICPGVIIS